MEFVLCNRKKYGMSKNYVEQNKNSPRRDEQSLPNKSMHILSPIIQY